MIDKTQLIAQASVRMRIHSASPLLMILVVFLLSSKVEAKIHCTASFRLDDGSKATEKCDIGYEDNSKVTSCLLQETKDPSSENSIVIRAEIDGEDVLVRYQVNGVDQITERIGFEHAFQEVNGSKIMPNRTEVHCVGENELMK